MTTITSFDIFESLKGLVKPSQNSNQEDIKKEIESLYAYCKEGMEMDSQKLLCMLLIKALNKNIHSASINENIYLKKYEITQIQLFNILIEKFPFVTNSQQITNSTIVAEIGDNSEVTIIDIGIGQGTQVMNIIKMSKELPHLKKMKVVGIEPFSDALSQAKKNILSYQAEVSFEIEFVGINDFIENVDFAALENLSECIIVNASLSLHHIQSDAQRYAVIARIKKLNPAAFMLIEPNVNHFEPELYPRLESCYNHYYALFQVIDKLDIEHTEKNALKLFFGREIDDVIGKDEKDRFEKHELASKWIERLGENGFDLINSFTEYPDLLASGVAIKYYPVGFLGFSFENEMVLAVMCAK